MTGPMRLAPAGMLLAATLALVAVALPPGLSLGAGSVPLGSGGMTSFPETQQALRHASRDARMFSPQEAAPAPVVARLRISTLRLPGEKVMPGDLPYGSVAPSWPRTLTNASRETMSEISRAAGVSAAALTTASHFSEGATIHTGPVLVQKATDAAGRAVSLPLKAHTVAEGESLWGISQEAGVSVATVVAANNLSDEHAPLRPGQVLMVPASSMALAPDTKATNEFTLSWGGSTPVSWTEFASSRVHTVAPGESLWAISQDEGVSMGALMAANNLSEGSVLHAGQLLMVPPPETIPTPTVSVSTSSSNRRAAILGGSEHGSGSAPRTYTVAYGDTLWDIAKDAGVSLGDILSVNQISENDAIHPGDILILPRGARDPALSSSRVSEQLSVLTSMDGVNMIWPTSGRITSGFGPRIHPIFGGHEFHTGVDIGTRRGNDVRAALSGIVRFAGRMGGYGRIVILDHGNGLETAYSHLDGYVVSRGQRVEQGQLIGVVGNTGWSTGPHLLFEIRKNGRAVNPMDYVHP